MAVDLRETPEELARFAAWYDADVAQGRDRFDKFRHHLHRQLAGVPLRGARVLEVGCGSGATSLYLALFGGCSRVVALDESAGEGAPVGVTDVLRRGAGRFDVPALEVVDADMMASGYDDGSFDLLIANRVLHHVVGSGFVRADPATAAAYGRAFDEMARLLAPGGHLTMIEISRASLWRVSPLKLRQRTTDWEIHPTLAEWRLLIERSPFELERIDPHVPHALRGLRPLLTNPVAQFLIGPNYTLLLRRR